MTETPERPELKSCPFCDAKLDALSNVAPVPDGIGGAAYYVFCSGCSVEQSTSHDSEADAIEVWNRRASPGDTMVVELLRELNQIRVELGLPSEDPDFIGAIRKLWAAAAGNAAQQKPQDPRLRQ